MRLPMLLAVALLLAAVPFAPWADNDEQRPDTWLRGADDDGARFERLERYLGGFSAAMREVGARYERTWEALQRAWRGFAKGRRACLQCHGAEGVEFMNDQPIFTALVVPDPGEDGRA